jgi:hypothetical protein
MIRLGKLPDRNPVKLTFLAPPDLHEALIDYAALYAEEYGKKEPVTELVPAMLATFLNGDRAFVKARSRKSANGGQ